MFVCLFAVAATANRLSKKNAFLNRGRGGSDASDPSDIFFILLISFCGGLEGKQ